MKNGRLIVGFMIAFVLLAPGALALVNAPSGKGWEAYFMTLLVLLDIFIVVVLSALLLLWIKLILKRSKIKDE